MNKRSVEKCRYGGYMPEYAKYISSTVKVRLAEARTNKARVRIFDEIRSEDSFSVVNVNGTEHKVYIHPGHKTKTKYWNETLNMASKLAKWKGDVILLPEPDNMQSADAIIMDEGKPIIVELKFASTCNSNTLQRHLVKGFRQADTIVLQLMNMDRGKFRETIDYMRRNNLHIGDIILMNRLGEIVELSRKMLKKGGYINKIQGFL